MMAADRSEMQELAKRLVDEYYDGLFDPEKPDDEASRDRIWDEIERLEREYGGRFTSMTLREFLDAAP